MNREKQNSARHWSWQYFYTDGEYFQNNNSNKNAWCLGCLEYHRSLLRESDIIATSIDGIGGCRTTAQREAQDHNDFYLALVDCKPMAGKPQQNMVMHLSKCVYVSLEVRAEAQAARLKLAPAPLSLGRSISWSGGTSSLSPLTIGSPSMLLLSTEPPQKRQRTSSFNNEISPGVWNPSTQLEYGEDFCRLLIATRSSWNFAHNPEVRLFFHKWIPGSIVPDRRTLSGPILDREAAKVEDRLKKTLKGKRATFQTDGWKNKAKQSIVATMVTVESEPYLMRTHDVSVQPKTGETLLALVLDDIKWSTEMYALLIIAVCSDDGGDARKMRRLLRTVMPWLIVIICWAHQINLIVGDYLSLKIAFLDCVPHALEVIKWMNNHSHALGIFRREKMFTNGNILALILPVITRWTAHYLSLRRLLQVDTSMQSSWLKYGANMIACAGSQTDAREKAEAIQDIIQNPQFWKQVRKTCAHLELLAIAANITQGSNTHLYHVLTTLANLFRIYSNLAIEMEVREKILGSLEKHWAAADQDPFIAAVVLNPFLRGKCLTRKHISLTPIGLTNMMKRLHLRVFEIEAGSSFHGAFMDYLKGRNEFSEEGMGLEDYKATAKSKGCEVDPVQVWEDFDTEEETGRNRLAKLAMHILNIIANSAGCERAFSHMGLVHTGIRSKLGIEKVRKTTIVGMDIKRSHIKAGLLRPRGTRNFFIPGEPASESDAAGQLDIDDSECDILDFSQISEQLIAAAQAVTADGADSDTEDEDVLLPTPIVPIPSPSAPPLITITIPTSARSLTSRAATVQKTSILLENLFIYPTEPNAPLNGMDDFWQGGIENLDIEMAACELLSSSGDENSAPMAQAPVTSMDQSI